MKEYNIGSMSIQEEYDGEYNWTEICVYADKNSHVYVDNELVGVYDDFPITRVIDQPVHNVKVISGITNGTATITDVFIFTKQCAF